VVKYSTTPGAGSKLSLSFFNGGPLEVCAIVSACRTRVGWQELKDALPWGRRVVHADLSTTLRIYTHVMKHRREGVAERLEKAIWGQNSGRNSVAKNASRCLSPTA
jgi:hypothetical protein